MKRERETEREIERREGGRSTGVRGRWGHDRGRRRAAVDGLMRRRTDGND